MGGIFDIRFYLSIFWRRFPHFLTVAVLIAATGITVAVVLPPVYRSTASILVESQQIPGELAASTVGVGSTEQIQIIEQRLMTRTNLLELARTMQIYADRPDLTASAIVRDMRKRTEFRQLNFGRGGATAFTISFEAPTAAKSAEVTNEFVTLVLQENVRIRTGRATDTLEFFEAEVARLGAELDRISGEILTFKNANEDALPDSLEFRRNSQARLQERLLQLEREETTLRDSRTRLIEIYERTGRLATTSEPQTAEEQELENLRQTLEQQLVLFSETNPKIVLLRNRIAALEEVVDAQRASRGQTTGDDVSDLDLQLQEIDGRLDYLTSEQTRLDAELAALTASIQATPGNELTLGALERRLSNTQAQYNTAVERLSQAATGERIELLSKGERFSVIEQATAPERPDRPNRRLLAAAAAVLGVAAGLGLVVLMELLNRSIRRPVELTNKLGIQAFGTIPYMRTRRERVLKRTAIGSILVIFAGAVPAAIWALHTYYLPLDLLLRQAAQKLGIDPYLSLLF